MATLRTQLREKEDEANRLRTEVEPLRNVQTQLKDSELLATKLSQKKDRLMNETSEHQTQISQQNTDWNKRRLIYPN